MIKECLAVGMIYLSSGAIDVCDIRYMSQIKNNYYQCLIVLKDGKEKKTRENCIDVLKKIEEKR